MSEHGANSIRVLVVDDDPALGRAVSRGLTQAGYAAEVVGSAAAALAGVASRLPDLLLLDIDLPDASGLEVCRRLRARFSAEELPIVVMTGQEQDASIQSAFEAGASDFLTKPLSTPVLVQRVRFALRATEHGRRLARGHEVAGIGQFEWTRSTGAISLTPQALKLIGSPERRPENLDELLTEHVHADDREAVRSALVAGIDAEARVRAEAGSHRTLKLLVDPTSESGTDHVVATLQDITSDVERRQRIQKAAYYDATTGLPNRKLFESRLDAAIGSGQMGRFAVLFADLDGFKRINDSLGHQSGDDLLRRIGAKLVSALRMNDPVGRMAATGSVGRWGGDEFALLVGPIRSDADAEAVADRILQRVVEPLTVNGEDCGLTLSIGIALYPQHGTTKSELIRNADRAMYEAKRAGGGRARVYEAAIEQRAQRRSTVESQIGSALESGQLHLEYQPRVALSSRQLVGAEALLRWAHPQLGPVGPNEFIPIAERSGAIRPIGAWAIGEACRELAAWRELAPSLRLACSVNVSALQLRDDEFARGVTDALIENQIDPRQLELEVTESMLLDRSGVVARNLARLSDAGVGLAIDDFGSGFSSLGALLDLPLTAVKVDRSIVQQVESSVAAQRVIQAVVIIARGLECKVVAEGVDNEGQVGALRDLGVDEAQGFLFSSALAPAKFHALIPRP